ncbi:MAG TPA: tRNA (uridine(34)/cytosine(34)/5-carboxymethylaminomethyluridine(34)-2'-O)-methyltransferase TrmL [Firmicutes bacterium]|jgi:tRNA (cytidine/uridine-2'-O-)-methyltransferase|nr:tRNA (uridine(34)/cytosine(34)/5-carboxymethylaminomethyluridine(34)-2'-O)-methyltransferase TrmL [Bacillota bacterium]HBK67767.1 tRNA (uridine(34)/cytosine(34)/5-carboxymethylaminomethyluridine(34)-2'-O)-methyltransferase TrmL [Bacillota bacterium]HBT15588.1 tRNA (uridine(34)/cytosine(34)/5-carboxymethylaminomethyluridine(34)-2'-O)-methyltransferase TrmL [Bacillota bacterium]
MNIVLFQPEIPQNTGNIARLCAATNSKLHLIEPFGFILDDRHLRRAGLDYWSLVEVQTYLDFEEFSLVNQEGRFFYLTTKGQQFYYEVNFLPNDYLIFGPETRGLPPEILSLNPSHNLRIPMRPEARSLNLANSVAIVLYEALRQIKPLWHKPI